MNVTKKIIQIVISAGILLVALVLVLAPKEALALVGNILCLLLFAVGIRYLLLYFLMARHMVGGRSLFYTGLIILDLSFLCSVVLMRSYRLLLLYLVGMHAFYGVVQLLRALEAKKYENTAWRFKLLNALINLGISVACIFFIRQESTMALIFAAGLVYTAIVRVVTAFRKEEEIIIQ